MPGLDGSCRQSNLDWNCFGRHPCPVNVVVELPTDRVIVKTPLEFTKEALSPVQVDVLQKSLSRAKVIVFASPKDPALSLAAAAMGNGARRYCQPTGSLPVEITMAMVLQSHGVVCNFSEWMSLASWAGLEVPAAGEDDSLAFEMAACVMQRLRQRRLAGRDLALSTLGHRGIVAADWTHDNGRFYKIEIAMLEGAMGLPTPAGAGDQFLGAFVVYYERWAQHAGLRDPVSAAAIRAMHSVANSIGLRRDQYSLETRLLSGRRPS